MKEHFPVLFRIRQCDPVHGGVLRHDAVKYFDNLLDGISYGKIQAHTPSQQLTPYNGWGQEDLPTGETGGTLIFGQQSMKEGGTRAEVPDDKDRLLDLLPLVLRVEQVIEQVRQADAEMP